MKLEQYIEHIKLMLTGGLLELEIPDDTLGKVVNMSLKELQRYINTTTLITIPYADCIDLNGFQDVKCSAIKAVYRTEGYAETANNISDPMYAQQWLIFSNYGSMYNLQNYMLNYMAYNTVSQIRNTTSTDLDYYIDKFNNKLYINIAYNKPSKISLEYIPIFENVEQLTSDFWINILQRYALAHTKIILGRIRSKYKQSNALWTLDGDQLLEEGNAELNALKEQLEANSTVFTVLD